MSHLSGLFSTVTVGLSSFLIEPHSHSRITQPSTSVLSILPFMSNTTHIGVREPLPEGSPVFVPFFFFLVWKNVPLTKLCLSIASSEMGLD